MPSLCLPLTSPRDGEVRLVFLAADGVTFQLGQAGPGGGSVGAGASVQMQFVGANAAPELVGVSPMATHTPVPLAGSSRGVPLPGPSPTPGSPDPGTIPTPAAPNPVALPGQGLAYAQVNYQNVYNGINLDFYVNRQGDLEYDWVVAPGADPSQIRMVYPNVDQLALDAQGNLQIFTGAGGLLVHAPVLYQEYAGPEGSIFDPVEGHYVVQGNEVTFAIGNYDHSRPLIIDPIVTWTGAGATNNWSEAANWSGNTVPTSADTAVFDGTSSDNATVDAGFAGTVTAVQVNAGYAGTVALNRDLTLLGAFAQAAGTFQGQAQTLTVTTNFTTTGGTFDPGTGTVLFKASTGGHTVDVNSALTFNHLIFGDTGTGTRTYTIGAGDLLNVLGDFTVQPTSGTPSIVANAGTIAVQGNVSVGAGANGGTTVVQFANTTADQTYTSTGGVLPVVEVANGTRVVSAAVGTTDLAVRSLILTSGTFQAPSGTLTITNDLTQTSTKRENGQKA